MRRRIKDLPYRTQALIEALARALKLFVSTAKRHFTALKLQALRCMHIGRAQQTADDEILQETQLEIHSDSINHVRLLKRGFLMSCTLTRT
jgi:hypothetical protein